MVEKITGPLSEQLEIQLRDHKMGEPCPLLVADSELVGVSGEAGVNQLVGGRANVASFWVPISTAHEPAILPVYSMLPDGYPRGGAGSRN